MVKLQAIAKLKKAKASSGKAQASSEKAKAKSEKAQTDCKKAKVELVDAESLEKDILKEARTIKMPVGEAKGFSKKVAEKVAKWAEKRGAVTANDINTKIADELKKYSGDLAFIYRNKGKII